MKKETLKQFIFKLLSEKGYVLDRDLAKFCNGEPNYDTVEIYKREWQNINWYLENTNYHNDPTAEIHKGYRRYVVRNEEIKKIAENRWQPIPKVYFDYLKKKGVKLI